MAAEWIEKHSKIYFGRMQAINQIIQDKLANMDVSQDNPRRGQTKNAAEQRIRIHGFQLRIKKLIRKNSEVPVL